MERLVVAIGLTLYLSASPSAQTPTGTSGSSVALTASASLKGTQGRNVGEAHFQRIPHGVLLKLELRNATPGVHALHIHGSDAVTLRHSSLQRSFRAVRAPTRFLSTKGPYAGDLPNIEVPASMQLTVEHLVSDVTLEPGGHSLLDGNGSSIVIHTGKDGYMSEPAGDSGDRIACGRIVRDDAR